MFFLAAAWDGVQLKTIRSSWNPLLGKENHEESTGNNDDVSRQMSTLIKNTNPDATDNNIDVKEWVECREENKFTFNTYEGIIKSVTKLTSNEEGERQVEEQNIIVREEAVSHFNHCFKLAAENDMPWQQILCSYNA